MGSIQLQIATDLRVYLVLWLSALMLSLVLVIYNRRSFALVQKSCWLFLFERWKLITFGPTPFNKVFGPCFLLCIPVVASIGWFVYMYIKN